MTNRELDKWIAENVMGWHEAMWKQDFKYWYKRNERKMRTEGWECWQPTGSISDAFQVVEKMSQLDYWVDLTDKYMRPESWECCFFASEGFMYQAFAETAPLAICLAAKKAIEGLTEGITEGVK